MTAPHSFTYKPALLAPRTTVVVASDQVTITSGWSLPLADVDDAAFVNHVVRRNRMVRLDLYAGDTRRSIGYNGSRMGYGDDPDAIEHLRAVSATLNALASAQPNRDIALGVIRGGRWGMFIVGVGCGVAGATLGIAALASGLSGERLLAGAIPTIILLLMGGIISYGNWPWRQRPRVRPAALAATLSEITKRNDPAP